MAFTGARLAVDGAAAIGSMGFMALCDEAVFGGAGCCCGVEDFGWVVVAGLASLAIGADTCCKGGGKRLGGTGLEVLLPPPRLLTDLRAASRSAFCLACSSACCVIAAQVLSLMTFHIASASSALANSFSLI